MNLFELLAAMKSAESCIENPDDLTADEIGSVLDNLRNQIEVLEVKIEMSA